MSIVAHQFDVAISFAGEDRELVEAVAEQLKADSVRVFYDRDFQADMWGRDLVEYFDEVYRLKSRFAVVFVSRSYASKMWTQHERRSALARALNEAEPYLLPVRLDDTELPGLRPTVGYLDARQVGVNGILRAIQVKLEPGTVPAPNPIVRVPRTEAERQRVLLDRPTAWEYLYFVGQLLYERDRHEDRYRDHEVQYAPLSGRSVGIGEINDFLNESLAEAGLLVDSLMRLMDQGVQRRAFGAPGEAGDPERLLHLAQRWNAIYVQWMEWAGRLRGTGVPDVAKRAILALARFMDRPVQNYRTFVDQLVIDTDAAIVAIERGERVELALTLSIEIDDAATDELQRELKELRRKLDD